MSTLLLRLAAPLQSWGSASKFDRRLTEMEPTKSGIIGMIACAMGIKRGESLAEFANMSYGVRIEQPGELGVDFQTVHEQKSTKNSSSWVTYRYYLQDAVFLVGIEDNREFLEKIEQALCEPYFPIYLGRRSCPPTGRISLGIREKNLADALKEECWHASDWYRHSTYRRNITTLEIVRDAAHDDTGTYAVRDMPITFSEKRRMYSFRNVIRDYVPLAEVCPDFDATLVKSVVSTNHDPMSLLEDKDVSIENKT